MEQKTTPATTVLLVPRDGLGSGEPELQHALFSKHLTLLLAGGLTPAALCFYTEGVKLVCEGSRAVPGIQLIGGMGVRLLICKTCLDYYQLADKVAVGQISTMSEIAKTLMSAAKVITI